MRPSGSASLRAYVWLLVPAQSVGGGGVVLDEIRADTAKERLAERASDRLRSADLLRGVQGPQNIRLNLEQYLQSVWSQGHIAVGRLWEYYCQYPYLPRLADRPVLETGILRVFDELTWNVDGFAVATGYVAATGKYTGLAIPLEDPPPSLSDSTLLVQPDRALAQRVAERTDAEARRVAAAEASAANPGATGGAAITPVQGEGTSPTDQGTRHQWVAPSRVWYRARRLCPGGFRPEEHPLLRHGPGETGAVRPRHQSAASGGHPAPGRP